MKQAPTWPGQLMATAGSGAAGGNATVQSCAHGEH